MGEEYGHDTNVNYNR